MKILLVQPFGKKLEAEADPDKKAMYKRMNAAITAGVEEMEKAMNNSVNEATLQQAKQVRRVMRKSTFWF